MGGSPCGGALHRNFMPGVALSRAHTHPQHDLSLPITLAHGHLQHLLAEQRNVERYNRGRELLQPRDGV